MKKEVEQKWLLESFKKGLSTTKAKMTQAGTSSYSLSERFERIEKDLHTIMTAFHIMKEWKQRITSNMEELVQVTRMSTEDDSKAADAIRKVEDEIEEMKRKVHILLDVKPESFKATGQSQTDNGKLEKDDKLDLLMAKEWLNQNEKLKSCFCSLSIFPADFAIKKRNLIYWWIGMGIVEPQIGQLADEIGEDYFQKLLNAGLVRPYRKNSNAGVQGCTLSPSVHSMAMSIARETGLCFGCPSSGIYLTTMEKNKAVSFSLPPSASFFFNVNGSFLKLEKLATHELQNLTVLQLGKWQSCPEENGNIKILDTVALSMCLGRLSKLRYLGLQGVSGLKELPDGIRELSDLRVLDLRGCDDLQRFISPLEKDIRSRSAFFNLKKLTHLDVSECYLLKSLPCEIASLPDVQVLKGLQMGYLQDSGADDLFSNLGKLKNLKKLGIDFGNAVEIRELSPLKNLVCLSTLTISWTNYIHGNAGEATLKLDWLPESIKKLDLRCFPLEELPPSGLMSGKLKNLEKLYFRGGRLQNLRQIAMDGALLMLKTLRLRYLKFFGTLTLSFLKESLPSLQNLDISHCPLSAQRFFDVSFHEILPRLSEKEEILPLLAYFFVYPEGSLPKKSHYAYWLISIGGGVESYSKAENVAELVWKDLVLAGVIKPVNRKGSSVVQSCKLTLRPAYIRPMAVRLAQELGYLGFDSMGTPAEKNQVVTLCNSSTKFDPPSLFNINMQRLQLDRIVYKLKNPRYLQLGRWSGYTGYELKVDSPKTFFHSLQSLTFLRYLGLRGISGITEIPASISALSLLRFLDLQGCADLVTVHPNGVATLEDLVHLDVSRCNLLQKMPPDFHKLMSTIEVMYGLVVQDHAVRLSHFNHRKLRKLSIVFHRRIEFGKETLHFRSVSLRVLSITWRAKGDTPFPTNCPSLTLGWFLAFLDKLELCNFPMEETPPVLVPRRFPFLKRLYFEGGFLCSLQRLARKTPTKEEADWRVEVLRLRGLQHLEVDWLYLLQCFSSLKYAEIVNCPKVTSFPGNRDGIWLKESATESSSSAPLVPETQK